MTNRNTSRIRAILERRAAIEKALAEASDRLDAFDEQYDHCPHCMPDDYAETDDLHSMLVDLLYRFDLEAIKIEPGTIDYIAKWRDEHFGQDIAELRKPVSVSLLAGCC